MPIIKERQKRVEQTAAKKNWLWFAGIYIASLAIFILAVYGLRWLMPQLLFW
jgi:flagellar biogenesis protein FliO